MSEWPDQGTVGEGRGRWGARVVLVLAGAVLVLLFWPQVNLEVTDKTGNESLPLWGPTKLARIARFLLLAGVTAALAWGMEWRVWRARWRRVEVLLGLVAVGTALAVLPGPVDGANLFLAAEFVVCVAAVLAAHRALGAWMEREAMAEVVHRVLLVMFALLVVIFMIAFLVEPEMVYRDKLRGWRLGGSIVGANTLAMVGLVVSVSAYALVLP
ncbi:MAG: hypothetical protein ACODAQ_07775, partial [Phycisphaeraceae bacterium]